MKTSPVIRTLIILAIVFMIAYAFIDGIRYGSTLGIIMSVISLIALYIAILLARKLAKLKQQEEEEEAASQ